MDEQKREKILFVDDEKDVQEIVVGIFEDKYNIKTASSVSEAMRYIGLSIMKNEVPDVILTDIKMPGESGIDLLKKLQEILPEIPVIMQTGHASKETAMESIRFGAYDIIEKPYKSEELIATVERAINKKVLETEVKLSNDKIIESHAITSLGILAGNMSRDILSPVSNLSATVKKLIRLNHTKLDEDVEVNDIIETMQSSIEKISNTVGKLNNLSERIEQKEFAVTTIGSIIKGTRFIIDPKYNYNHISFNIDDIPNIELECNRQEIIQVLTGILNNAEQALENNIDKKVTLEIIDNPDLIQISIKDNGPGISESDRQRIFEPFFTTLPAGKGVGLGLSNCKKIIERHNGILELDDTSKNTKFNIVLPKHHLKVLKQA